MLDYTGGSNDEKVHMGPVSNFTSYFNCIFTYTYLAKIIQSEKDNMLRLIYT